MARAPQRFTVYDMMEAKGIFEKNPANVGAKAEDGTPLYKGPVPYPKMLYHPKGETRILNPGVVEVTPYGPKVFGELLEVIHVTVNSAAEEKEYISKGWHTHPAHAVVAGGGEAPAISPANRIEELEAKIRELEAQRDLAELESQPLKKKA